MNKQIIFGSILVIVVGAIGVGLYAALPEDKKVEAPTSDVVFYYGDTCPHCKNVEEFVAQNNVQEEFSFVSKEVYNDLNNSKELKLTAKKCGLEEKSVGVPLLWTGENCLVGDTDIIAFFQEKIGGAQE